MNRQDKPGNLARCINHLCPQRANCHRYQLALKAAPTGLNKHGQSQTTVYTIFTNSRGICRDQLPIPQTS